MSSWCPILVTPSSSSSWWVMCSSCSPPICSRSKLFTYCWRQSSRPEETRGRWKLAKVDFYLLPLKIREMTRQGTNNGLARYFRSKFRISTCFLHVKLKSVQCILLLFGFPHIFMGAHQTWSSIILKYAVLTLFQCSTMSSCWVIRNVQ